jgi:hypothetical protein
MYVNGIPVVALGRWAFLNKIQAYFAFGEICLLPV